MKRALLVALVCACSDDAPGPLMLACDGVVTNVPGEPGLHVPFGTQIEWSTNPPATGRHFPAWAKWDRHYTSLDRGFWMHNAEHGGVVMLYNCPGGCPDVVASLVDVVRSFSTDGACGAPVRHRLLVAADPMLPAGVQVAAVAWNATYTASCYDPYILAFTRAHYNKGPEDLCTDGLELGGTFIDP